ncbi:MAG: hypothetical protein GKS03_08870 [Alphaproteobacteria bacterium]|nr:hypothetical protein [Alphaproteobacteria bacterium]
MLAWRLSDGPITIDFLAPYVSDAISNENEGIVFEVQGASLAWGGMQSTPDITVQDVMAFDLDGNVVASFPEMLVRLSMASILDGSPAPEEIVLENPVLRLTRNLDGAILLGLELNYEAGLLESSVDEVNDTQTGLTTDESANQLLNIVVSALTDPAGSSNRAGYLDRVIIQNSTVVFSDAASGSEWLVPSGDISLERQREDLRIAANLPYLNGGRTSKVDVNGTYVVGASALSLSVDFEGVRPSSFSVLTPQLGILSGVELDVDGTLSLGLTLRSAPVVVDLAQLTIVSGNGILSMQTPIDRTYPVERFEMTANARNQFDQVSITDFKLAMPDEGPVVALTLEGRNLLNEPSVDLDILIDRVSLADLKAYWPEDVKPNTRRWITSNLNGGEITEARFDVTLSGSNVAELKTADLAGSANLAGISVTYLRQMPPVEETLGILSLSLSEVVIDVESGVVRLNTLSDDLLHVREARVRLHGLANKSDTADIDVRIDGQLADAISLIDSPPLGYASKLGIAPSATSGLAEVLLSVDFPLIQGVSLSEVGIDATASLQQTSISDAAFGLDLESGQFSLGIDNLGMDVSGTASLGGIRTGLAWRENFTGGDFRRQYALDAVVENDQRPLIGLRQAIFAPPYVDGPIRLEAIYTVDDAAESTLVVEADLQTAELRVPSLNWHKPTDVNGILSAEILVVDGSVAEVRRFDAVSEEAALNLSGNVKFLDEAELHSIDLQRGQIGRSQFEMTAKRSEDDVFDIELQGQSLDGRTFWSSLRDNNSARSFGETGRDASRMAFRFRGQLDQVLLSNLGNMTNLDAKVVQGRTGISEIIVNADVAEADRFTLTMQPRDQIRTFEAASENGGAVFRSLGLGDDFRDGKLTVSGTVSETGAISGNLNMDTFKIVDAPLLARLLSVAALTGIVDELGGTGISFSELNVPFTYTNGAFTIKDGAMYGPSLGLTAMGTYDTNKRTLDGDGTIIPAYAVNSALGGIPILGPLLTGGEESGGVFAATYAMRGNPDGAEVTVNPLATLTPGFLRQIFRVFDPPPAVQATPETDDPTLN